MFHWELKNWAISLPNNLSSLSSEALGQANMFHNMAFLRKQEAADKMGRVLLKTDTSCKGSMVTLSWLQREGKQPGESIQM